MATGYTFTKTGNTTKVVHVADDIIDAVDGITAPVWIQNKGTTIEISQGGSVLMSMPATAILTIDGDPSAYDDEDHAGTIGELIDQLTAVFPEAGSGEAAVTLDPPTGISATAGDEEVTIDWTNAASATGAKVYYNTADTTVGATLFGTATGETETVTGLTNDTPYYFFLRSVATGFTQSAFSTSVTATPSAMSEEQQRTEDAITLSNTTTQADANRDLMEGLFALTIDGNPASDTIYSRGLFGYPLTGTDKKVNYFNPTTDEEDFYISEFGTVNDDPDGLVLPAAAYTNGLCSNCSPDFVVDKEDIVVLTISKEAEAGIHYWLTQQDGSSASAAVMLERYFGGTPGAYCNVYHSTAGITGIPAPATREILITQRVGNDVNVWIEGTKHSITEAANLGTQGGDMLSQVSNGGADRTVLGWFAFRGGDISDATMEDITTLFDAWITASGKAS